MNNRAVILLAALALLAVNPPATNADEKITAEKPRRTVTPEESERIIRILKSRGAEMYRQFAGVESLRKEVIREYDPATGNLKSTSEVTVKRMDYYYKEPEIEVMTYSRDGKEMKPSSFRVMKNMPSYPVFDEKGDENYSIAIEDTVMIGGKECYRVRVTPRKETMRHFSGNIYFMIGTLQSVLLEGTMAKMDFPLKSFRIELQLAPLNGVPVVRSGLLKVRVNVPIFYPDTMIETSITAIENRLLR